MKDFPKTSIFQLNREPLETASYKVLKPFQALIQTSTSDIQFKHQPLLCRIFEATQLAKDDEIYVDGQRDVFLVRNGTYWSMRVIATSMNAQILAYPVEHRSGIARIKPIQSCFATGFLGFVGLVSSNDISILKPADITTIDTIDALTLIEKLDLVKCCDYTTDEWRLTRPFKELRLKLFLDLATA